MTDTVRTVRLPLFGSPLILLFLVLFLFKIDAFGNETVVTGWSWWLITLPLWGPAALLLAIAVLALVVWGIGAAVLGLVDYRDRKRRKKRLAERDARYVSNLRDDRLSTSHRNRARR